MERSDKPVTALCFFITHKINDATYGGYTSSVTRRFATFATFPSRGRLWFVTANFSICLLSPNF